MLYINSIVKEKLFQIGINLVSYCVIPFENATICIILVYKENYLIAKMHSNSLDMDYYNEIIFCDKHGVVLSDLALNAFFSTHNDLFLDVKKRFPNHFKN